MGVGTAKRSLWERGFSRWPIFSLSLAALTAGVGLAGAAGAAPALPSGGHVAAGSATIASAGGTETIQQSSAKAVIDWTSFSIGKGAAVSFANGSGATLNEVGGGSTAQIDGLLSATGSVYVIDPAGVIVGKSGVVNVGGAFAASTLDPGASQFLKGGPLTFAGASTASVVNLGKIGSLGGDVALIGATVRNSGRIVAPNGDVGLAAGAEVVVQDRLLDGGKFAVVLGGPGTSVTNGGLIQAAEAELRANGGNVYALAGNNGSQIEATGVAANDGKVFLVAEGGETVAHGTIAASAADGAGGQVETSGKTVDFTGLKVTAANWLVDPANLTVDSAAAATISSNLASTSVTLKTTLTGASGPGNEAPGEGDIIIDAPITWGSDRTLTLDAYAAVSIMAPIRAAGRGGVVLTVNDGGTLGVLDFGDLSASGFAGSVSFTGTPDLGQSLTVNGHVYTLIYTLAELQSVRSGFYALARPLDLTGEPFSGPVVAGIFKGTFEGLGNAISGPTIDDASADDVGLFAEIGSGGSVADLVLKGAAVTADGNVGLLAGENLGTISDTYAAGSVTASGDAGGLVGRNGGMISSAETAATVSVRSGAGAGGIAGDNTASGIIQEDTAEASGSVTGLSVIGGLVGDNQGEIDLFSTALGAVTANNRAGGLVGVNSGTISDGASGALSSQNTSITTLATVTGSGNAPYFLGGLVGVNTGEIDRGSAAAAISISGNGAHGIGGFVGNNSGGTIAGSGEADSYGPITITGTGSFLVGGFVGLNWNGGTITGARVELGSTFGHFDGEITTVGGEYVGGFAGYNGGTIENSGSSATVDAGTARFVGGFAGGSDGPLSSVSATGDVTGGDYVGGLAGFARGNLTDANYGNDGDSVTGAQFVGGLVGDFRDGTISGSGAGPETVTGTSFVGGLVGRNLGTINSSSSGADSLQAESIAGGLVGYNDGHISDSTAGGGVNGAGSGQKDLGGLVGENVGAITTSASRDTQVTASGGENLGGLAGYNNGSITQSFSDGSVDGGSGGRNLGALVGANGADGSLANSYADSGSVAAGTYAGGLVGYNLGAVATSWTDDAVAGGATSGGVAGFNSGTFTHVYWDTATSGRSNAVGSGSSTGATGVGGAGPEPHQQSTYIGFNFSTVWTINAGTSRPFLQGVTQQPPPP
jgi:filamentous hemagglutinin family protein